MVLAGFNGYKITTRHLDIYLPGCRSEQLVSKHSIYVALLKNTVGVFFLHYSTFFCNIPTCYHLGLYV